MKQQAKRDKRPTCATAKSTPKITHEDALDIFTSGTFYLIASGLRVETRNNDDGSVSIRIYDAQEVRSEENVTRFVYKKFEAGS